MGWRYRKSINLGGGFRINLSKSGIGYSWGVKGYRVTHTANGQKRKTYSIPGTGLSYVETVPKRGRRARRTRTTNYQYKQPQPVHTEQTETGSAAAIQSQNLDEISADDVVVNEIVRIRKLDHIATILCATIIALPIGLIMKIYLHMAGYINLNYSFDSYASEKNDYLVLIVDELRKNEKVWRITNIQKNKNLRYSSGAATSISRIPLNVSENRLPWFVKTNINIPCVSDSRTTIHFLPDRILIISKDKIYAVKYGNLNFTTSYSNYVEEETVPSDAAVVGQTWKRVNVDGSPDRRFRNNSQIPICKYGLLQVTSEDGINFALETSNADSMTKIHSLLTSFVDIVNKESESEKAFFADGDTAEAVDDTDESTEKNTDQETDDVATRSESAVSKTFRILLLIFECFMGLGGFLVNIDEKNTLGSMLWVAYTILGIVTYTHYSNNDYKRYRLIVLMVFVIAVIDAFMTL